MRELAIEAGLERDTEQIAEQLAALCRPGTVIALDGDLGAGKTRLTQGIARSLGIEGNVNSPTFTIIKEYAGRHLPLYHMDVYRIGEDEAAELGLEEYFDGDGVSIVEWASLIESLLPPEYFQIYIEVTSGNTRLFRMQAVGESYAPWLEVLAEMNR